MDGTREAGRGCCGRLVGAVTFKVGDCVKVRATAGSQDVILQGEIVDVNLKLASSCVNIESEFNPGIAGIGP